MAKINSIIAKKSQLSVLYILGFIFAFTSALPAYVNSSYLTSITSEHTVGLIYSAGYILSLISLILIPKLLRKYGNYRVAFIVATLYFLDFLGLAYISNTFLVLFCFIISGAMSSIIYFNLDIFIEHNSSDIKTGGIRSYYLTSINLAWLVSPWLAGAIVNAVSYKKLYFVVALITIPVILIMQYRLNKFKDPEYKPFNVVETIRGMNGNKNIRNIWMSSFLLQLFYSWMIIYTPIYLNRYIGFDWGTIGLIFSIMLLPFVLIQVPLGYLADRKFGEKEILTVGFIIMGLSTIIIPFVNNKSLVVWSLILFMTRVGAAMVELMSDTYLFKNVTDKNLNIINLYRTTASLAYIVSAIITTILIIFMPLHYVFYILGILMFFGLRYSLGIKDTK